MAKKRKKTQKPRAQTNIRLPDGIKKHLDDQYLFKGWDKPLQIVAAMISFECLSKTDQESLIPFATRILQSEGGWDSFLDSNSEEKQSVMKDAVLRRMLQSLVEKIDDKAELSRRPA